MVKCKQCGFKNQDEFNFCGNCGFKLSEKVSIIKSPLNALAYLHILGGTYLILSIILIYSAIIEISLFLLVGGSLNLYMGWMLYTERVPKFTWIISLTAITLGLFFTVMPIYWIPDWIIFIVMTIALWQSLPALKERIVKK
ncbi:MAG: zinc ribbon domain-containing protein [Candidatus Methylarchaceae archaeon HK02M2]|nr:zinc ribbon domain-containing protein [Candidatus Methylarchaceae archaeon HK02M2]